VPNVASLLAARLGGSFDAVVAHVNIPGVDDDEKRRIVADVLIAASEYGGVGLPRQALVIGPAHTTKSFPSSPPALTTRGLVAFYERRRWGFFLLRAGPLLRAFAGQNERLQEVLALYEAQCATEGVPNIPAWADGFGVAGGDSVESEFTQLVERGE